MTASPGAADYAAERSSGNAIEDERARSVSGLLEANRCRAAARGAFTFSEEFTGIPFASAQKDANAWQALPA